MKAYPLAIALALAAVGAFAQQTQPRAPPVVPFGNEMGFFRPQADPALTRIVPPPAEPAPAADVASIPVLTFDERLRWTEEQMQRAQAERPPQIRPSGSGFPPPAPAQGAIERPPRTM